MCIRDRYGDMDMAEAFVRFLVGDALENSAEEVEFLTRFGDKGLRERLEHVKETPFVRCSYTAVSYTQLDVYKRQCPD